MPHARHSSPLLARLAAALLVATSVAGAATIVASSASAATGTITGTVSAKNSSGVTITLPTTLQARFIGDNDTITGPVTVTPSPSSTTLGSYTFGAGLPADECGIIELSSTDGYWTTKRTTQSWCPGQTVPLMTVTPAGLISGQLSGFRKTAPYSTATALTTDGKIAGQAWVSPTDGSYKILGVPPGSYLVAFDWLGADRYSQDTLWSTTNQIVLYRSGTTGVPAEQASTATKVTVSTYTRTGGINATSSPGGTYTGTLTCLGGRVPATSQAFARPASPWAWPVINRASWKSSANGDTTTAVAITGLSPAVTYTSRVWGCTDARGVDLPIYSGNTLDPRDAKKYTGALSGDTLNLNTAVLFRDVNAFTQFVRDIQWMVEMGYSTGYGDDTYRPVTPVRRDAMAAFLFRIAGSPADYVPDPALCDFVDITPSTQFYREMCWMRENNVSNGWVLDGKRYYRPQSSINRDAMARFLYVFAGQPTPPTVYPFADVTASTAFHNEMNWMYAAGISKGWLGADGKAYYRPTSPVNRDAMAAFVHRYVDWFDANIGPAQAAAPGAAGVAAVAGLAPYVARDAAVPTQSSTRGSASRFVR